jgi:hypothetical protein
MPRTATLELTADELSQLHIALEARIEAFERVAGEPDGPSPEVVAMVRHLNQDIIEARRAV